MGYVTLYRKWRPQTFEDVVGQEHIVRTLTNALRDNRVAHAYLFSGPRGTGKTSIAKILAKSLNCADGPTAVPCNKCASCTEITAGSGLDVIEIDAASNRGIDEIRDIREKVKFMPAGGGTKVYIIDEVHMLTPEAFNALLKMLEEPPAHVIFILATTEPHKVLPTILSRCQRFDFRRLKTDELAGRLRAIAAAEGVDIDDASIAIIAKQAKGGMRDAVSTLDQLSSYTGSVIRKDDVMAMLGMVDGNLLFRLADIIMAKDVGAALVFVNEIVESGWDLRQFAKDLTEHFRNLFVIRNTDNPGDGVIATVDELKRLAQQAEGFSPADLITAIDALTILNNDLRFAPDARLILELALVKMTQKQDYKEYKEHEEHEATNSKIKSKPEPKTPGEVASGEVASSPIEAKPHSRHSVIASDSEANSRKAETKTNSVSPSGNELDTIIRAWPAVLDKIKKTKMSTFANLLECRPVSAEGNVVVLEFHDRAAGHMDRICNDANKTFVESVLRDLMGKPYVIKCVVGEKSEGEIASGAEVTRPGAETTQAKEVVSDTPDEDVPPLPTSESHSGQVTERSVPTSDSKADSSEHVVATLAGLFDATVKETKERKNEG